MPKVAVYNVKGEQVGEIELKDSVFGVPVNVPVMHEAVLNYLANQRQGTHSTKTRGEVRGGGRKPWRQKGTGRARQGSIRAPQWIKGGIVFGPKPRDYSYKLPKKVKRLALKSALSSKVRDNEIIVLDEFKLDQPKTKKVVELLKNFNVDSALIVVPEGEKNVELSARNIPGVKTLYANYLNTYDILKYDKFIITKDAVGIVEEVYA
ncbi:LSU ribosomal protein L4P [Thermoanaerobacter thermohydrosulfuricus]|jgi:LSU ribosomal protein L4P|uniref:Large ribosomal subunit protein uL4 n=8 Tax=Thermoanaerobacter TaxID=1754 RepID=RL4_THEP3|nr:MULTISPECIES: 50S ribosomal protein L4 [Thermoanaerobacter]B0K5P4.1 RecName: Full=Large ribosomal subunit protein uL4; AltName: Full=50S ribosomal protein L4 [Thermoanaerobacter sp. X514]B0KCK1.1 RecName: Full=Large ribosomal subunit protein uL4; AltName: Full=50S ribosomal protein L4 [Thermoanaerobacter pseudethanolicus ATCC 33223]EGD51775.1 ribosomal protein L4/L1e [Thermoanaerobacter ethanolicus JW 200]ABY92170.1 ribosomal protein L4/L1e [Thermoanaerobacter sp. X514]ABY94044.1 ribosomal 